MASEKELEVLRSQIRSITTDILKKVQERMELASQVGEVKNRLGIDVKDEKVEQEIRTMVIKQAEESKMNREFALRLLNILLAESEAIQAKKCLQMPVPRQTHLGIFQKAKQLEAAGNSMIHLEVGEPDYSPPIQVGNALSEAFKQKRYHYTDTRGVLPLRQAIATIRKVDERNVLVTPGGRFAIFAAISSLVMPGEEIIVIEPAWPAYKECAEFIGARTKILKTSIERAWTPDLAELESMITAGTKMIVLNYPNNPTGKILDADIMQRIVAIAKDHGLYLLSDEVYSDYAFRPFESLQSYAYDRSITVSSFSKTYAMTGFRIGYAIANQEIIKKMTKVQATGITSVAEPIQYAALAAVNSDPSENVDLMKSRLHFLAGKIKEMGLRFTMPEGAMYVYPELLDGEDIELVERLLGKGVAIAPGSGFGESYKRFIRISACRGEDELAKGLAILADELGRV